MVMGRIINEIDTYLSVYPIKLEKPRILTAEESSGNLVKAASCLNGMRLTDTLDRDEKLERLIEDCSEDMLEKLVEMFGEDSPVADIIRRKRTAALRQRMLGKLNEFFMSHPIIPKRIKAIDLFSKSVVYAKARGMDTKAMHGLISQHELTQKTEKIIEVMG